MEFLEFLKFHQSFQVWLQVVATVVAKPSAIASEAIITIY
jgi:hypothetical protein